MKNQLFFENMLVEDAKISLDNSFLPYNEQKYKGFTKIEITVDHKLAKQINRREGKYFTYNFTNPSLKSLQNEIAKSLAKLLGKNKDILVVGLGNRFVTSDSLGENTIKKIQSNVKKFCPSVKSLTNIDSVSVVQSIVKATSPDAVLVIDSLATSDFTKLCTSIQITDAGIVAGGGVTNSDKLFSKKTMGVPVIAIGVPLIINLVKEGGSKGLLCPHQIDGHVNKLSDILSKSIDLALK